MFKKYEKEIKAIVDAMRECGLDEIVLKPRKEREPENFNFYEMTEKFGKLYGDDWCEFNSGATKGVALPYERDFVIKFPLYTERDKKPFDFCLKEAEVYEEAKRFGLEGMLAAVEVFKFDDVPYFIYVQEKVEVNENDNEDLFYEYGSSQMNKDDFDDEDDYDDAVSSYVCDMCFEDAIYAIFGEHNKYAGKLINLFNDMNVNDIHQGNFGYDGCRPVLIDYSGY